MAKSQYIPIYMQVQEYAIRQIQEGKWKAGDKIPTEKELMKQFNVSRITISNALANLVKEGWIHRIQGKGSYVIDKDGQAASEDQVSEKAPPTQENGSKKKPILGLVMPSLNDYFSIRLVKGISDAVDKDGRYQLLLLISHNSPDKEAEAIDRLLEIGVSGLLLFPADAETYSEEVLRLKLQRYPFVVIDRYLSGLETHFVGTDGVFGTVLAYSFLHELGHRQIAICSDIPISTTTVEQRIAGYMKACKDAGEMINPALMLTDFHVEYDRKELDLQHLLYKHIKNKRATAYITLNGKLALHIIRIASELGMEVPRDFSLVTFDNPMPSREFSFFTHVYQHEFEVGSRAVHILMDLMEHAASGTNKYRRVVLQPQLISGQSTSARQ